MGRGIKWASVALSKSTVVDAALELLREAGLPGMSMRTLAARLEVQPSALYWHFPSKQALLTGVAERVLAGVGGVAAGSDAAGGAAAVGGEVGGGAAGGGAAGIGAGGGATAELRAVAHALRAAVVGVPDGAEIVALGLAAGAANPVAEAVGAACERHGLEGRAAGLTTALTGYVIGLSLEEQTHHNLAVADPSTPPADFGPRFEGGLEALLAGVTS